MPDQKEYVETLAKLGLTHLQAKVYTALLSLKTANARNVQRQSNIARQDIYRILTELEEKDLVEKIIAKPAKFRPIPANEAISTLLQKRKEENHQLRKKATQLFRNFKSESIKTQTLDENSQFILLSKSETNPTAHIDKLGEAVSNAQTSVMCQTTFQLFMKVKFMDEQIWKKAVKRGVKFRYIIERRPENEKLEPALDPVLKNTEHFEIRWTPTIPPACVLLVDEREAFCRMGLNVESPVLWSTASHFVAMIKDYFETKWKSLENSQKQQTLSK
jgi:sugar-specific transcriptional regulator TrmB